MNQENILNIALAQISPVWLNKHKTIDKIISYVDEAGAKDCDLVVFGEGLLPGYPFWLSYTNGACTSGSCNLKSGRICGQPPMPICPPGNMCIQRMPDPIWYENECELIRANASALTSAQCSQSNQI